MQVAGTQQIFNPVLCFYLDHQSSFVSSLGSKSAESKKVREEAPQVCL